MAVDWVRSSRGRCSKAARTPLACSKIARRSTRARNSSGVALPAGARAAAAAFPRRARQTRRAALDEYAGLAQAHAGATVAVRRARRARSPARGLAQRAAVAAAALVSVVARSKVRFAHVGRAPHRAKAQVRAAVLGRAARREATEARGTARAGKAETLAALRAAATRRSGLPARGKHAPLVDAGAATALGGRRATRRAEWQTGIRPVGDRIHGRSVRGRIPRRIHEGRIDGRTVGRWRIDVRLA